MSNDKQLLLFPDLGDFEFITDAVWNCLLLLMVSHRKKGWKVFLALLLHVTLVHTRSPEPAARVNKDILQTLMISLCRNF